MTPWRRIEAQSLPVGLSALVLCSVLAIGGVHWGVAAGAALGASLLMLYALRDEEPTVGLVPMLLLAFLGLFSLLQAVPLPLSMLQNLSPAAADIWSRSLLPLARTTDHGSISLDPGASLVEGAKWLGYAAAFYAASVLSRRRGPVFGVTLVFVAACAVALATLVHVTLGVRSVFGVYEPRNAIMASHIGPLLNANNLAGYGNVGVLCGLGLLLGRERSLPRWLLGIGVVLLVSVVVLSASRGGAASLLLGVAIFGVVLVLRSRRDEPSRRALRMRLGLVLATIAGGIGLGLLGADRTFWAELLSENVVKLSLVSWARPLVGDYRLLGVGRGAFESVFPAYRPAVSTNVVFTHPENVFLQWVTEWGVPVAVIVTLLLALCFGPFRLGVLRSTVRAGAWLAVFMLGVHNLVDLSLELSGVAIAVAALLGSLWGASRHGGMFGAKTHPSPKARWLGRSVAAVGVLVSLVALLARPTSVDDDRLAVRDAFKALVDGRTSSEEYRRVLVDAITRHPAEPYFALMGAVAAQHSGTENPIPWIQRALERGPTIGRTHLVLAEVLARRGATSQALLELRLALEYEPDLADSTAKVALRLTRDPEKLLASVPSSTRGVSALNSLARSLTLLGDRALCDQIDREILSRDPAFLEARMRAVEWRLSALASGDAACHDMTVCEEAIRAHAAYLAENQPRSSLGPTTFARLELTQGDPAAAEREIRGACVAVDDRAHCLEVLVRILAELGDDAELDDSLKELQNARCKSRATCAAVHEWVGELRLARGQLQLALGSFERAIREEPTAARHLKLADVAERAGMFRTATEAVEQAARLQGSSPQLEHRIRENRTRAFTNEAPRP